MRERHAGLAGQRRQYLRPCREGHTPGAPRCRSVRIWTRCVTPGADGMLGVLTALETVAHYHRQGHRLPLALEVIGFADEEGARFGVTLLGSRGLTGQWLA